MPRHADSDAHEWINEGSMLAGCPQLTKFRISFAIRRGMATGGVVLSMQGPVLLLGLSRSTARSATGRPACLPACTSLRLQRPERVIACAISILSVSRSICEQQIRFRRYNARISFAWSPTTCTNSTCRTVDTEHGLCELVLSWSS